ncbi:hypothetical protein QBC46DRAFT_454816 [Diplogelasinospora grovesii]|uniref:Uncharacterized protein n=1 Tax=Diplogelasinospora grovesii TaxID=303347 RepID=A0AAN6NJ92_9PEZI|nr:hypothetical protein QBC46DRAFT_454816 [Diplogelasinospora grovesii]
MCRKYQRIGKCGHVYRENGSEARHCSQAHGGRSTVVTHDNTQICGGLECYQDYVLMPNGWTCHKCGGQNNPNTNSCVHSDDRGYSSGSSAPARNASPSAAQATIE